ncbi:MAG TPA: hypothetical protein PKA51_12630, partial [Kiritimatiellia bacterium]|nr:hypothetical protein [Kiritimatiellia bacterium]
SRKQLLLDDVNAINTAAFRADLIQEPHRTSCRSLLKQYVDVRVRTAADRGEGLADAIRVSEDLLARLWRHAIELARADLNSDIGALFVESINDVYQMNTSRLTVAIHYHIPPIIWTVLGLLTILSMIGVGYQFGVLECRSNTAILILAFSFSLVVGLIADLDRSTTGLLKVSQKPMLDLQARLTDALDAPE